MNEYLKNLDGLIKSYFKVLSNEIPEFLYEYINTPEMQKQAEISMSCGTIYSKLFDKKAYSSLEHSIGVALIIWNFTKSKKQTLSGLFHDIATPVFKHCVDFMNGDYEVQESTEELTTQIISKSKEIMCLLNRDDIKVEEVCDYHMYSIADNDTPKLAADRLEYTLSNGLGATKDLWDLDKVKRIYQNIEILKNEDGIDELGFKDKNIAEEFVHNMSILSSSYIDNRTKFSMQFLADVLKKMSDRGLITKGDLYNLSEKEIIKKIENCEFDNISKCFDIWKNAKDIKESDIEIKNKYLVSVNTKIRYIIPLVEQNGLSVRINKISDIAKKDIEKALNYKTKKYAYLDFNF